jgi:hypothetical protein
MPCCGPVYNELQPRLRGSTTLRRSTCSVASGESLHSRFDTSRRGGNARQLEHQCAGESGAEGARDLIFHVAYRHGSTISDPHRQVYAMAAEGHDDQGIPFYLHEMPSAANSGSGEGAFHNGEVEGDVSYLTMVAPDLDAAHAFCRGAFAWTFDVGRADGAQVTGVAPRSA